MPITLKKQAFRLPSPPKPALTPAELKLLYGNEKAQAYYEYPSGNWQEYESQFGRLCQLLTKLATGQSLFFTPEEEKAFASSANKNKPFVARIKKNKTSYESTIASLQKNVLFHNKVPNSPYATHKNNRTYFENLKGALETIVLKLSADQEKINSKNYTLEEKIDALSILDQTIIEASVCDEGAYKKLLEIQAGIKQPASLAHLVAQKLDAVFTVIGSMHCRIQEKALKNEIEIAKRKNENTTDRLDFRLDSLHGNETHAPAFFKDVAYQSGRFPDDMPFEVDRFAPIVTRNPNPPHLLEVTHRQNRHENFLQLNEYHANVFFNEAFDRLFNSRNVVSGIANYIIHGILIPHRQIQKQLLTGDRRKITQASNECYEQINLMMKELGFIKDDEGHEGDFFDYFDLTENRWAQKSELEVVYWAHVYACRGLDRDNMIEGLRYKILNHDYCLATDGTTQWIIDHDVHDDHLVSIKDFLDTITQEQLTEMIPHFHSFGILHALIETIRSDYPDKFEISDELIQKRNDCKLEYNISQCESEEPFFAFDDIQDLEKLLNTCTDLGCRDLLLKAISSVPRSVMHEFFTKNLMSDKYTTRKVTKLILNNLTAEDQPHPSIYISREFLDIIYHNLNKESNIDDYIPPVWFGKAPEKIPVHFTKMTDTDHINALLPPSTLEGLFELYPNMLDRYLQEPKDVSAVLTALDAIAGMEHRKNLLMQLIAMAAPKIKAMLQNHPTVLVPLLYAYADLCEPLTGVKPESLKASAPGILASAYTKAYNVVIAGRAKYKPSIKNSLKLPNNLDEFLKDHLSNQKPDEVDKIVITQFLSSAIFINMSLMDIMAILASPAMRDAALRQSFLECSAMRTYMRIGPRDNTNQIPDLLLQKLRIALNKDLHQSKSVDDVMEKYHLPAISKAIKDHMTDPTLIQYWLEVFATKYFVDIGVISQNARIFTPLDDNTDLADFKNTQWLEDKKGNLVPPLKYLMPRKTIPLLRSFGFAHMLDTALSGKEAGIHEQRNMLKNDHNLRMLNTLSEPTPQYYYGVIENLDDITYILENVRNGEVFRILMFLQPRELIQGILTEGLNSPTTYKKAINVLIMMNMAHKNAVECINSIGSLIVLISSLKMNLDDKSAFVNIPSLIHHAIKTYPEAFTLEQFNAHFRNATYHRNEAAMILFDQLLLQYPEKQTQAILGILPFLDKYTQYHHYLSKLPASSVTAKHKSRDAQLRKEYNERILCFSDVDDSPLMIETLIDIQDAYYYYQSSTHSHTNGITNLRKRLIPSKEKIQNIFHDALLGENYTNQQTAIDFVNRLDEHDSKNSTFMRADFIDELLKIPNKKEAISRIPMAWRKFIPLDALKKLLTSYNLIQQFYGKKPAYLFEMHPWVLDVIARDRDNLDTLPLPVLFLIPRAYIRQSAFLKQYLLEIFDQWMGSYLQSTMPLEALLEAFNFRPVRPIDLSNSYDRRFLRGLFLRHIGQDDKQLTHEASENNTLFCTYNDPAKGLYVDWIEPANHPCACLVSTKNSYNGPCFNPKLVISLPSSIVDLSNDEFYFIYIKDVVIESFFKYRNKPAFVQRFQSQLAKHIHEPSIREMFNNNLNTWLRINTWLRMTSSGNQYSGPEHLLDVLPKDHELYPVLNTAVAIVTGKADYTDISNNPALFLQVHALIPPQLSKQNLNERVLRNLIEHYPKDEPTQRKLADFIEEHAHLLNKMNNTFPFYVLVRPFATDVKSMLINLHFNHPCGYPNDKIKFLTMLVAQEPQSLKVILETVPPFYWPELLQALDILPAGRKKFDWLASFDTGPTDVAKQKIAGIFHSYKRHESWGGWFKHLIGQSNRPHFIQTLEKLTQVRNLNYDQLQQVKNLLIQHFVSVHDNRGTRTDETLAIIEAARTASI